MAATPEKRVKSAITKWLTEQGYYYFYAVAGPFSVHGVPDLVVCAHGRFVGIECKAPGKEKNTTRNQLDHIARIAAAGGQAFVASSVEAVREIFAALGFKEKRHERNDHKGSRQLPPAAPEHGAVAGEKGKAPRRKSRARLEVQPTRTRAVAAGNVRT